MKRFISFIGIICLFCLTSCKSSEQLTMESILNHTVKPYAFVDFKEYGSTSLTDEIDNQLRYYKSKLTWDKSFYEAFEETLDIETQTDSAFAFDHSKVVFYKQEISKDLKAIEYLTSINDSTNTMFITYRLSYMYVNDNGDRDMEICFGQFDENHNIIAFKPNSKADWTIIRKTIPIPDNEL